MDGVGVPPPPPLQDRQGLGAQPPPDYSLELCKLPLSTREEALPGRRQLPNVPLRSNQDRRLPTQQRVAERSASAQQVKPAGKCREPTSLNPASATPGPELFQPQRSWRTGSSVMESCGEHLAFASTTGHPSPGSLARTWILGFQKGVAA